MPTTFLNAGESAPWFKCRSRINENFSFDTVAGRYIVLCFFESAAEPMSAAVLEYVIAERNRFDDENLCFFGVSVDPADELQQRIADLVPGIRYFWDFDRSVSMRYGAADSDNGYRRVTYVLDPRLRVVAALPFTSKEAHLSSLQTVLNRLPKIGPAYASASQAPVLVVPRIFEPDLCQSLINYYAEKGSKDSGFMRDVNGSTVGMIDYAHKRRRDCDLEDEALQRACATRIQSRLMPEIYKAFQFLATRMERYIVACYDASEKGHFRAHRDNTTKGTAHRRFAVSLFLNAGEYEGGLLRFPEFGPALYAAPVGGAVVFSCSLLHEATPVTQGRRYMFLPFLYDEAARRVREKNFGFLKSTNAASFQETAQ